MKNIYTLVELFSKQWTYELKHPMQQLHMSLEIPQFQFIPILSTIALKLFLFYINYSEEIYI